MNISAVATAIAKKKPINRRSAKIGGLKRNFMSNYELHIPHERFDRNANTGQFLKGHTPHNKGKKWNEWMSRKGTKRASKGWKNLIPGVNNAGGLNAKPVICMDDEGTLLGWYPSAEEAGRRTGVCGRNIRNVADGNRGHAGGFIWEWA